MYLLKHLPIYKFTDGPTDGDLVSSVYFDNDASRLLYEGRLKKYDGAIALRIRWCATCHDQLPRPTLRLRLGPAAPPPRHRCPHGR